MSIEADNVQRDIFRKMSHKQKYLEFEKIYLTAKKIKAAGLRRDYPEWTEEMIQQKVKEIFLYGST